MRTLWLHRRIDAPAATVWALLATPERWPEWGPTVRGAEIHDGRFGAGATGVVTTVAGVRLPFEVTTHEAGARWAWKVAGVPATDHTVEALGRDRSRVGFGVPWPAAAYLGVCWVALRRIQSIAVRSVDGAGTATSVSDRAALAHRANGSGRAR